VCLIRTVEVPVTVGWVTGRASGPTKQPVPFIPKASILEQLEEKDRGENWPTRDHLDHSWYDGNCGELLN